MLGQKDAAIKEAERAITLLPTVKDAVDGPTYEENLAYVEVLVGDKNRAIPRLQRLLEIPYQWLPYARASKAPSAMGPFAWRSRFPKTLRGKAAVNLRDSGQPWIPTGERSVCQKENERISTMPFLLWHFSPGDKIENWRDLNLR